MPTVADARAPTPVARRPDQLKLKMSNLALIDDHLAHHQRRDNAASPNGNSSRRDNHHRRQDGNDLGMTTSRRSISPAAVAVNRSPDSVRGRERTRKHHHSSRPPPPPLPHSRGRSAEPSQQNPQHRRRDQVRSPDPRSGRLPQPSHRSPHSRRNRSREEPTRREPRASPDRRRPDHGSPRPRKEAQDRPEHRVRRRASRSPVPSKRRRSPSPPLGRESQSKKARQDIDPADSKRGLPSKHLTSKFDRSLSPRPPRAHSPTTRDQRSNPTRHSGRSRSPSPPRRHRSRSPRDSRPPRHEGDSRPRARSPRDRHRSPRPDSRHRSRSRRRSPRRLTPEGNRLPNASDTGSRRRGSIDQEPIHTTRGSGRAHSPRGSRHPKAAKGRSREESRSSRSFDPASGANSIEVNMAARGGYRGGFNPQSGYPKGQYDARGYGQSPGHGTPVSSFHGSPTAQSPYNGSGRGWSGQPQFSPQGLVA